MTHRGPFQPRTFCDSVILLFAEHPSSNGTSLLTAKCCSEKATGPLSLGPTVPRWVQTQSNAFPLASAL